MWVVYVETPDGFEVSFNVYDATTEEEAIAEGRTEWECRFYSVSNGLKFRAKEWEAL